MKPKLFGTIIALIPLALVSSISGCTTLESDASNASETKTYSKAEPVYVSNPPGGFIELDDDYSDTYTGNIGIFKRVCYNDGSDCEYYYEWEVWFETHDGLKGWLCLDSDDKKFQGWKPHQDNVTIKMGWPCQRWNEDGTRGLELRKE